MDSALLSTAPLASLAVVAALLARAAVVRWFAERSGRVYELPTDYRPVAFRAAAALLVLAAAIGYAIQLAHTGTRARTASAADTSAARHAVAKPPPAGRPLAARPRPVPHAAVQDPAPRPPRTVAHPVGGTLQELPGGTRVWLPPQYDRPGAPAFPLVAAYVPAAPDSDQLYAALAGSITHGMADPLIVVLPRDCSADPSAALDTADRYYRTERGREARAVIGVGDLAPCAVRAELAHPDRYRAAAGVSGTYDAAGIAVAPPSPGPRPRLLLAAAVDEARQRASGLRLRTALRRGGVRARFLDEVTPDPALGGGTRRHLLALVSGYLTEELRPHPYRQHRPYRHRHRHRLAYGRRGHWITQMEAARHPQPGTAS
ncbi:hypothetical protein ABZ746_02770 [Streptomyces sp. NPDC020096]